MSNEASYTWQQKWIAIAPKPFSLLSILGSSYILKHILTSKERRSQVYHHILLGLCAYDIIASFTMFWGTWAIPSGTPNVYLASGTIGTCNAQAFLQQLGVAVPIYTAELAAYYFLVVSFSWKERQLKRIEILLHLIPSALGWTSSIVGIATNSFSDSVFWCWYSPDKYGLRFGLRVKVWVFLWYRVGMHIACLPSNGVDVYESVDARTKSKEVSTSQCRGGYTN